MCVRVCVCVCVCVYIYVEGVIAKCYPQIVTYVGFDQGHSQPKCDGGASQLSSTVANLYAIRQYGPIKLFTLDFLNKSAL